MKNLILAACLTALPAPVSAGAPLNNGQLAYRALRRGGIVKRNAKFLVKTAHVRTPGEVDRIVLWSAPQRAHRAGRAHLEQMRRIDLTNFQTVIPRVEHPILAEIQQKLLQPNVNSKQRIVGLWVQAIVLKNWPQNLLATVGDRQLGEVLVDLLKLSVERSAEKVDREQAWFAIHAIENTLKHSQWRGPETR